MAIYAIGDVHGCWASLQALLGEIRFDPRSDRLWLVGDLVNRGPASAQVLRWARDLDDRLVVVLGNHDLNLLAMAAGVVAARPVDNSVHVLDAPDAPELIAWLGRRPVMHREVDFVMVHAGLLPAWSLPEAERWARAVEEALAGPDRNRLLATVKREPMPAWGAAHPPAELLRLALGAFAHLRTLDEAGCPARFAGPPAEAPPGCRPWFDLPHRRGEGTTVIFGHWAALGLYRAPGVAGLDTGCAWGGALTAMRLDDGRLFQVENRDGMRRR
ncbi:MAG TPA: symmetrical bis(5'-nucleosyl)-tetraphosphatase [Thermoanaerobaculia bacterium]|nr:symmetrical bis(5'-nucleosyl)-tetraphosphatase [Thermoanaerobaculia bacterium]